MAYALENLGAVANHRGDPVTATRHITESLTLFREIDDKVGILIALDDLGVSSYPDSPALRLVAGSPPPTAGCDRKFC